MNKFYDLYGAKKKKAILACVEDGMFSIFETKLEPWRFMLSTKMTSTQNFLFAPY